MTSLAPVRCISRNPQNTQKQCYLLSIPGYQIARDLCTRVVLGKKIYTGIRTDFRLVSFVDEIEASKVLPFSLDYQGEY